MEKKKSFYTQTSVQYRNSSIWAEIKEHFLSIHQVADTLLDDLEDKLSPLYTEMIIRRDVPDYRTKIKTLPSNAGGSVFNNWSGSKDHMCLATKKTKHKTEAIL